MSDRQVFTERSVALTQVAVTLYASKWQQQAALVAADKENEMWCYDFADAARDAVALHAEVVKAMRPDDEDGA